MQSIKKKSIVSIAHLRYMTRVKNGYSDDELHLFIEHQDTLSTIEFNDTFVDTLMQQLKYIIEDTTEENPKLIYYTSDLVQRESNCNSFRISIVIRNWGGYDTLQVKTVLGDYLQNRTIYELAVMRRESANPDPLLMTLTSGFFRTTAHTSSTHLETADVISIAYNYLKPFH